MRTFGDPAFTCSSQACGAGICDKQWLGCVPVFNYDNAVLFVVVVLNSEQAYANKHLSSPPCHFVGPCSHVLRDACAVHACISAKQSLHDTLGCTGSKEGCSLQHYGKLGRCICACREEEGGKS